MAEMNRGLRRRDVLTLAGGVASLAMLSVTAVRPSGATPAAMQEAIRQVVGESPVKDGKVKLDIPPLVENGNTVPLTCTVDSPMTEADHVKAVHIFNEKNPQPNIISVTLGPRAGRAHFGTRVRLADSQKVVAIAEMSDGTFWSDSADVIVTLAACVEDLS